MNEYIYIYMGHQCLWNISISHAKWQKNKKKNANLGPKARHQCSFGTCHVVLRHHCYVVVFAGLRLNNAWASGSVLRPFLQPESPLSSRSLVSGFKCKLRDSNSRPPYSRPRALTTRLYTIHINVIFRALYLSFDRANGRIW